MRNWRAPKPDNISQAMQTTPAAHNQQFPNDKEDQKVVTPNDNVKSKLYSTLK